MLNKYTCAVDGETRLQTHCNICGRTSIHIVEAILKGDWGDREYSGGEEHRLLRCGGCDTIKYSATHWDEQDIDFDEDGDAYLVKNPKYYPAPQTKKLDSDYFMNLPMKIYDILSEVLHAQSNNDLILSTMGLRLLLESICDGSDCKSKTLNAKINELEAKGLITAEEKDLFHEVRKFGNAGAHAGEAMTSDQVASGIDICVELLNKQFIQPAKKKKMLAKAKTKLVPKASKNRHLPAAAADSAAGK
jgi:hypothetical protein